MANRMERQQKGRAPTLLSAKEANKLIGLFNAMQSVEVRPAGSGTALVGEENVIIDLSEGFNSIEARLTALEAQGDVYTSLLTTITAALANASISCNTDGTISLTFPGIDAQPPI